MKRQPFYRLAVPLAFGVGLAWAVGSVLSVANADNIRSGAELTLYRTRLDQSGQWAGYSYANFTGADFRDFALTVESHRVELKRGRNSVQLTGFPETTDRSTVTFRSKTDPKGTKVLEQRLVYDLDSSENLFARAIGKPIKVRLESATVTGTLLTYDGGQLTIKTEDKDFPVRLVNRGSVQDIEFGGTELVTSPTLEWVIEAEKPGTHEFELTYRAHGVSWQADYTAVFDPDSGKVDLSAYATIRNSSGADFKDVSVRMIHRQLEVSNAGYGAVATVNTDADTTRIFALGRPVTIRSGERMQLDLFPPISGGSARSLVVYESVTPMGYSGYPNTDCYGYGVQPTGDTSYRYLEIEPTTGRAAGSFPPGTARVFRRQKKGALELVSEEPVQFDAEAKKMRIKVGTADGIKASRKQLDCRVDERARELHEKIELTVNNEAKEAVEIVLRENMSRWPTWSMESESEPGVESGKASQEYKLKVPAKGSKSVTYSVKYSW